jgi:hypothetical protein
MPFTTATRIINAMHAPNDVTCSARVGGMIRKKSFPFISDAKLETQNGIRKSRNVNHKLELSIVERPTLRTKAVPTSTLIPNQIAP